MTGCPVCHVLPPMGALFYASNCKDCGRFRYKITDFSPGPSSVDPSIFSIGQTYLAKVMWCLFIGEQEFCVPEFSSTIWQQAAKVPRDEWLSLEPMILADWCDENELYELARLLRGTT